MFKMGKLDLIYISANIMYNCFCSASVHSCPMCDYGDGNSILVRQHVTQNHPNWREILHFPNQIPSTSKSNQIPSTSNPTPRAREVLPRQTPVSKTLMDEISDDEEPPTPHLQTR